MENEQLSILDCICETHVGLKRQGPGSSEMTIKALSYIENLNNNSRILDLGCGTGGQTMVLAQNLTCNITGVDFLPVFIEVFNDNAKKLNLQNRVKGIVGSIEDLPFQNEEFDLIWSEGVVDNMGFEKGLTYWNSFLKKNGFVAVTSPSWLNNEHPVEVANFWSNAGSGLDTIEKNISVMQKSGYSFIAAFTLPENCWTDNYFNPRAKADHNFLQRYIGNKTVETYIENNNIETELYSRYKQYYGYVFYIGKKL